MLPCVLGWFLAGPLYDFLLLLHLLNIHAILYCCWCEAPVLWCSLYSRCGK